MCVSRAAYRISSMESLDVHMNTKEGDVFSRDQSIVDLVSAKGLVDIHDLAEQFGVTPQTIRRSVNRLCEQGLLRRVHGGVTLPASVSNLPWDTRQVQQLDAKRAIALKVAALIPDGSSVSIGLGTTRKLFDMDVVGEAAAQFFGNFKTDFAVFGVGGIDEDGAL